MRWRTTAGTTLRVFDGEGVAYSDRSGDTLLLENPALLILERLSAAPADLADLLAAAGLNGDEAVDKRTVGDLMQRLEQSGLVEKVAP